MRRLEPGPQPRGLENLSFVVGDAASVELDRDLDAVVGRCVLFFAPEPATLVRRLTGHVGDGGIVAFQEPANATLAPMSLPHSHLLEQLWAWILETYRRAGMDLYMGLRLRSIFAEAGLPAPTMHLDAAAGGGPDWPIRVHGPANSHDPAADHKTRSRDRGRGRD